MKKLLLILGVLLSLGMFCACSSDDDKPDTGKFQLGDSVIIYGIGSDITRAVYQPIAYQDAPEWIKVIIDGEYEPYVFLYLYQGEKDGEIIYLKNSQTDSMIGTFFDKNGKIFKVGEISYAEFFAQTSNWKLIFYYSKLERT